MSSVEKLTADLQDTARVVAEMASRENRTLEQNLAYMGVVERMNLLQREWATKVLEIRSFACSYVWSRSFAENWKELATKHLKTNPRPAWDFSRRKPVKANEFSGIAYDRLT